MNRQYRYYNAYLLLAMFMTRLGLTEIGRPNLRVKNFDGEAYGVRVRYFG